MNYVIKELGQLGVNIPFTTLNILSQTKINYHRPYYKVRSSRHVAGSMAVSWIVSGYQTSAIPSTRVDLTEI